MNVLRFIFHSHYLFWTMLTIPSWGLVADIWLNERYYAEIMYESGTWSVVFVVVALTITPLMKITNNWRPIFWLQKRRRAIGVASFSYAALHTYFYIRNVGSFELVLLEAFDAAFWLGWIAFLMLLVLTVTSNQTSVRKLGRAWKPLQRGAYAALVLSFLHWLWIEQFISDLVYWATIAAAFQILRFIFSKLNFRKKRSTSSLQQ